LVWTHTYRKLTRRRNKQRSKMWDHLDSGKWHFFIVCCCRHAANLCLIWRQIWIDKSSLFFEAFSVQAPASNGEVQWPRNDFNTWSTKRRKEKRQQIWIWECQNSGNL